MITLPILNHFFIFHFQVIADIDGDGVSEMIVAVSYFFDREYVVTFCSFCSMKIHVVVCSSVLDICSRFAIV